MKWPAAYRGQLCWRVGGTSHSPTLLFDKGASWPVGAILSVRVKGVSHEGLWTGSDVVHKSARRGKVARESLAAFGAHRVVSVVGVAPPGAVDRALARMGEPWGPVANCQRFVAEVSGVPRRSRDADTGLIVAVLALVAGVRLFTR